MNHADFLSEAFKPLLERFPTALASVYCFAECGPGWMPLVIPVLEICERLKVPVTQIKQKFGGLRIYVDGGPDDQLHEAIAKAERESFHHCEQCGEPPDPTRDTHHLTLCTACWAETRRRK